MKYIERSNSCISERNVALQEKKLFNEYEQKAREKFNLPRHVLVNVLLLGFICLFRIQKKTCIRIK